MPHPLFKQYLNHLYSNPQAGTRLWADHAGRAQGRYFNSTLTSSFQPVRVLQTGEIVGYEGFARSYSDNDQGLCLWKLLDHAANDEESVELDRLCRMLHAINFFRQEESAGSDLYLSVHARLLAAVEGNHGTAFRRVLMSLGLPQERIVLQLPVVTEHRGWLVNHVADNYRRNGFRIAVNASDPLDAASIIERVHPEVVKVDTRHGVEYGAALRLLEVSQKGKVRVIFKRVGSTDTLDALKQIAALSGQPIHAQGFLWDLPRAVLGGATVNGQLIEVAAPPVAEQQAGAA